MCKREKSERARVPERESVCIGERARESAREERARKRKKERVRVCLCPQAHGMPGFALHEITCLYEQVLQKLVYIHRAVAALFFTRHLVESLLQLLHA